MALAYALPTLWYAMGNDQAAFFYMGRGWLHGVIPFRDAVELKPPGIYAINALGIALFGETIRAIRLLDLAAILVVSVLVAHCVRSATPRPRGFLGVCALLGIGFYYTNFDYWDTGQVEIWEGLCLLAAWASVDDERPRTSARLFLSGVLVGLAFLFKFTALAVAVAVLVRVVRPGGGGVNRPRWAWFDALLHIAGGVATLAVVVVYFAAHHALRAVIDILYFVDRDYVVNKAIPWRLAASITYEWFHNHAYWCLLLLAGWCAGMAAAIRRRDDSALRGGAYAVAMLAMAAASVAVPEPVNETETRGLRI